MAKIKDYEKILNNYIGNPHSVSDGDARAIANALLPIGSKDKEVKLFKEILAKNPKWSIPAKHAEEKRREASTQYKNGPKLAEYEKGIAKLHADEIRAGVRKLKNDKMSESRSIEEIQHLIHGDIIKKKPKPKGKDGGGSSGTIPLGRWYRTPGPTRRKPYGRRIR